MSTRPTIEECATSDLVRFHDWVADAVQGFLADPYTGQVVPLAEAIAIQRRRTNGLDPTPPPPLPGGVSLMAAADALERRGWAYAVGSAPDQVEKRQERPAFMEVRGMSHPVTGEFHTIRRAMAAQAEADAIARLQSSVSVSDEALRPACDRLCDAVFLAALLLDRALAGDADAARRARLVCRAAIEDVFGTPRSRDREETPPTLCNGRQLDEIR